MEHPLITDIDHLTIDELQSRINDLTKKLAWASRSGNAGLAGQIRLALDTFQAKYQAKQQAIWEEAARKGGDHSDKISIS